ncbi:hematopoietic progenitor cell antigen CD34 isoform X2 [Prinia subflava]
MKWRQLLRIAVCLLELAGCAAGSSTDTPSPTATAVGARDSSRGTASTATAATTTTGHTSSARTTSAEAAAGPVATSPTSAELLGQLRTSTEPSPGPASPPGSSREPPGSAAPSPGVPAAPSPGVPTARSPPAQPGDGDSTHTAAPTAPRTGPAATPERPAVPAATSAPHTASDSPERPLAAIGCHRARDEGDTAAVCLQLSEPSTCELFLERKGSDLWQAMCENRTHTVASPCEIKLTPSSLDGDCLLLILRGEKDPDKLLNALQKSHWEKLGIESLKKESARSHRDPSQRTLIALVTSGLLLAFLGLAGYFLMRRRSWSPAGERL